jgi:PAS domain S-box-containing protein
MAGTGKTKQQLIDELHELRKRLEQVSEKEQHWRLFSQATSNMLWNWDFSTNQVERNSGFETAFGYAPDEVDPDIGWWVDRLHDDDRTRVLGVFEAARDGDAASCTYEYRFRCRDDSYVHIIDNVFILRGANGVAYRALGAMTDVTIRRRAEEVMRLTVDRYRALAEKMDEGFCVIEMINDRDGKAVDYRIVEVNPAFVVHTGLTNALGKTARELIPDLDGHWVAAYDKVARTGESVRFDRSVAALRKHYDVFAFRLDGDADQRVAIIFRDITDRKRVGIIELFSREILMAREEERKRVSTALHNDVGSLAVGLSAHFDAIEGNARSGKPEAAVRRVKQARQLFAESVARLKTLAVTLRPPELDVLGLRQALRQHCSQVSKSSGLKIDFRDATGRRHVPEQIATTLFRVTQEALTNAIRHGHATHVHVRLGASKQKLTLVVRDDGTGFESFAADMPAGTGMGVRAMREMATSAGGTVTIASTPGTGTTVHVGLPIDPGSGA